MKYFSSLKFYTILSVFVALAVLGLGAIPVDAIINTTPAAIAAAPAAETTFVLVADTPYDPSIYPLTRAEKTMTKAQLESWANTAQSWSDMYAGYEQWCPSLHEWTVYYANCAARARYVITLRFGAQANLEVKMHVRLILASADRIRAPGVFRLAA